VSSSRLTIGGSVASRERVLVRSNHFYIQKYQGARYWERTTSKVACMEEGRRIFKKRRGADVRGEPSSVGKPG